MGDFLVGGNEAIMKKLPPRWDYTRRENGYNYKQLMIVGVY
jgi:hypothetical protein